MNFRVQAICGAATVICLMCMPQTSHAETKSRTAWCRAALARLDKHIGQTDLAPNGRSPDSPAKMTNSEWLYLPVGPVAVPVIHGGAGSIVSVDLIGSPLFSILFRGIPGIDGFSVIGPVKSHSGFSKVISIDAALGAAAAPPAKSGDSPASPSYWETLAKRKDLVGLRLIQLLVSARRSQINCKRATDRDMSVIYALYARSDLPSFDSSPLHHEAHGRAFQYKGIYALRELLRLRPGAFFTEYVLSDGKSYIFSVMVDSNTKPPPPVISSAVTPDSQPEWLEDVWTALGSGQKRNLRKFVIDVREAGIGVTHGDGEE